MVPARPAYSVEYRILLAEFAGVYFFSVIFFYISVPIFT